MRDLGMLQGEGTFRKGRGCIRQGIRYGIRPGIGAGKIFLRFAIGFQSMEKNRIRPIAAGKNIRMSYSRQKEVLEMPNLIEVQKHSYQWFLEEGLKEVFDDISPIADYSGHLSLEFVDFELCEEDVKYSIEKCKERDATYAAPLKVRVRLYNKEKEEISEHEIFMGDLPLMTETGTFVINGAERVIVSQLVRSPGIYYAIGHDKIGKRLFSSTVIPNRGAWLEYETDSNDVFYVRVDRTRKVPITVLIRALGVGTNDEIRELFGDEPKIEASFGKDVAENYQEGLLELYKKIRPGEPLSVESAESLITAMFFDPRRYDLAKVGRYKFNKKLAFRNRIRGHVIAEDVVDTTTGEVLAAAGTKATAELADAIQNAAVPYVYIQTEERNVKILSNMMVDITNFVDCNPKELGITELVYYPVLAQILEEYADNAEELAEAIQKNVHELIPKHITKEDILASINYNIHLEYGIGNHDDIDHLGNRRIRAVGVRTFRCLNRTHPAVMGVMYVPHLKSCPVSGQTARPERGKTPLMGQFTQRIILIHKLGQLGRTEKFFYRSLYRLNID